MSILTWYGVSAVQLVTKGVKIVIDPYLTKSPLGKVNLDDIEADIVLVTHGAKDHFGDAVELVKKTGAWLIAPVDVITSALEQGVDEEKTRNLVPGATRTIMGINIKALHVQHISFTRCPNGKVYTGVALSYLIETEEGIKIYHAGDSALHSDYKLFGKMYSPDIALMPIGMFAGAVTEMDPHESSFATQWLGVKHVIPVHYDTVAQADYAEWFVREIKERDESITVHNMEFSVPYELTVNEEGEIWFEKVV